MLSDGDPRSADGREAWWQGKQREVRNLKREEEVRLVLDEFFGILELRGRK